jgi:hypothetical protein
MSAPITGGESAKKIVVLTDGDMKDVKALEAAGFAGRDLPDNAFAVLSGVRRRTRETPQQRYEAYAASIREVFESDDPHDVAAVAAAKNAMRVKCAVGSSSVHVDKTLQNLSIQYANDEYIGAMLAPPVVVDKKSDSYFIYDKRSRLAGPDVDDSGDDADATEITDARSTASYLCKVRAYKNRLSTLTLSNQDAPLNEMVDLTESLAELRALRREIRIAEVMTTAGNYATANKVTLSGADQWDSASGGNPIKVLQTADGALWKGRGASKKIAFSGLEQFHALSRHPDILGLFQYNGSSPGLATPDMIARFLGWNDYLVGRARKDTAKEGQTASYSRIWGDFFGVAVVPTNPSPRSLAFALTFRWAMKEAMGSKAGIVLKQWFDPTKGLGGSWFAEMGEAV